MRFSEVPLDDFEQNVLEFSHNPPSDAGVYWNIRQSGGWIWANSKTIVAG
ncbi:MAG: phosphoglucomutase, partial [Verrucomicrobiales bacterium]